jgi:hypothetical protein
MPIARLAASDLPSLLARLDVSGLSAVAQPVIATSRAVAYSGLTRTALAKSKPFHSVRDGNAP